MNVCYWNVVYVLAIRWEGVLKVFSANLHTVGADGKVAKKVLSLTQAHEAARHELKLLRGEPQSSRQTYQAAETTFTAQASGGRRFTPRDMHS